MFLSGRLVEDESIDVRFNAISHVTFTTTAFDDVSKVDIYFFQYE